GAGIAHHLMVTAGPSAAGITASACKRILACLAAGDPDGAAREVEGYLRVLKNGRTTSEHKHYGEAHTEALKTSADGIFYPSERGFSSTIWVRS
ncbi:MAG TPA: hypothetical protein VF070_20520, partial [Streptosporangiaceae bacterium]